MQPQIGLSRLSSRRPTPREERTTFAKAVAKEEADDRAKALETVCEEWADCHEWYYQEAAECTAFYHGDHYGYWDRNIRSWVASPEAPSDMVRLTVNLIQPIVEQGVSILTQEKVQFGVVAATSEGRDSATSEAGDAILEHGWHSQRMGDLYHKTAHSGFVTGTGLVHEMWDDTRGTPVETGQSYLDENALEDDAPPLQIDSIDEIMTKEVEPEGDHFIETLLPEEWVPDPAARGPYDGSACFVRKEVGIAELYDQFPVLMDEEERQVTEGDTQALHRLRRLSRLSQRGGGLGHDDFTRETTLVYIAYQRATSEKPRGYMAIFACGKMLYEGANPVYPSDMVPQEAKESWPRICWPVFVHRHLIRENSPWGLGPVAAMIDVNKAINGTWSKTIQHIAKIANAKVALPKGLDVEWSDEHQVLRYPRTIPANAMGYINPPPMPPEFINAIATAREFLEFLAGVNAATAGQQPYADTSGRALQLLQNRDFGRLAPVKGRLDGAWAECARYYLFLFRRHASTKRKILVVGENKRTVLREFDQSALAGTLDVITFNDQSIPRNPTDRILWITNLAQNVLDMTQPAHRELAMELLNLRDFKGFIDHQSPHRSKARRENLKLMRGEQVAVWDGDDHLQHIATLEELILSEEFESQSQREGPQSATYANVMKHWAEHKDALAAMQAPMSAGPPSMPQSGSAQPAATSEPLPAPEQQPVVQPV